MPDIAGLYELPNDPRPGLEVVIGYATGSVTDPLEAGHGALHLASYGLSLVHDHPVVKGNAELKQCCEKVKELVGDPEKKEMKAADWSILLPQLLPLIIKIIQIVLSTTSQAKPEECPETA